MKRWLVTYHDQHYPRTGSQDWVKSYAAEELELAVEHSNRLEAERGGSSHVIDMWPWLK